MIGCTLPPDLSRSIRAPARLARLAKDRPGVGYRAHVPELVGIDHRADHLDLPVEDVEGPGVDDLAVPVAEDRTRLAVHLAPLYHAADPDERRDERGEHPG